MTDLRGGLIKASGCFWRVNPCDVGEQLTEIRDEKFRWFVPAIILDEEPITFQDKGWFFWDLEPMIRVLTAQGVRWVEAKCICPFDLFDGLK